MPYQVWYPRGGSSLRLSVIQDRGLIASKAALEFTQKSTYKSRIGRHTGLTVHRMRTT